MTEEVTPIHGQVVPTPAEWVAEPRHEEPVVPVEEPKVEEVIVIEPTPEVVVEPTPPAVEEPVAKSKNEEPVAAAAPAYGSEEKVVHTSALVFKAGSRNSVSVALVQERLVELGFGDAGSDKYGWLCEGTMKSLAEFANTSVDEVSLKDASLIEKLFQGTQVKVIS
jgi:hypothetical protein